MRLIIFLFILFSQASFAAVVHFNDSVSEPRSKSDSIAIKVDGFMQKAVANAETKPLEAIKNYRSALVAHTKRTPAWEAGVRTEIGKLLFRVKSSEAIPQLLKADALYKKNKNLPGRAEVLSAMAGIYEKSGKLIEAQKTYDDLIKVQKEAGEAVFAGNAAFHLANNFYKRLDYNQALKYAVVAEELYYSVCKKDSLGPIYYKIAQIKNRLKSPNVAAFYITNKALPFYSSVNNLSGRMQSFEFLGHLYRNQKRLSEAKWFFIQANTLSRELNDTVGTIKSLVNLGLVKIAIGDVSLAKADLKEADQLATEGNYSYLLKDVKAKHAKLFKAPVSTKISASASKPGPSNATTAAKVSAAPIVFAEYFSDKSTSSNSNSQK